MRTSGLLIIALFFTGSGCVVKDGGDDPPDLATASQELQQFSQAEVDNAFAQASNSNNNVYGDGTMHGNINGRPVSWKSTPWAPNNAGEQTVCTYGWCGWWPIGDCSKSSGDSNASYSYGACNSTAWGERFAGLLWNNRQKANYKTKVSGTTTFGYHPYWCFRYGGAVRTYHGWSYSNHCGSKVDFEVGAAPPPPAQCGNGVVEAGEQCDQGAGNGTFGTCCGATCQFLAATSVCRTSMGDCDRADTCSGTSASCPTDSYENSGSVACTIDSECSSLGNGYKCVNLTGGKRCWRVCRDQVGACDSIEYCHADRDGFGWYGAPGPACGTDLIEQPGSYCTYGGQGGYCTAGGICDTASVPAAWTCDETWWGDGKCDCGCGAYDNDCNAAPSPVFQNCPGGQSCTAAQTVCVATTPPGWGSEGVNCSAANLGDGFCDCGCGGTDPDCDKLAVRLKEHCGSGYSCSWAENRCHNNTASYYILKNGNTRFGKCPKSWSTDSICDIGCQFKDPKCGGPW
jgi:hypothetical protein